MMPVMIEKAPSDERLSALAVTGWPVWSCEVSEFPWHYDSREVCYILEGKVLVTSEDGVSLEIEPGDLVLFPAGMSCRWNVLEPVRKHYRLG